MTELLATLPPETVAMTTRDGVRLDADVYRPAAAGPYPVLLMRQAYGRRIACTLCYAHPRWYAAHGYIVVVQDIRGRGTSEGVFTLGRHDAEDGAETIAWAAKLPGSNGRVGMYGFSYQGYNQYMAASLAGPELQALAPAMAPWDAREGWSHSQGAFRLQSSMGWATQLAAETARHAGDADAYAELARAAKALPLGERVPARPAFMDKYREFSHYTAWRDTPPDDPYWQDISPAARLRAITERKLPALLAAGWYDSFLEGSLAGWKALHEAGAAPAHLVVGPWGHFPWGRRSGAVDFGPEADGGMDALHLRWFDRWLKDADNGVDADAPVRLFDLGSKSWRSFDAWPQGSHALFLAGSGLASLDAQDGRLLDAAPQASHLVDCVVTDPWRPAPSVGGAFGTPPGAVDRAGVDARGDVLTYTSARCTEALTIAGDVALELHVACDRPSFDLACTLSRVQADGKVIPLAEGYRRVAPDADTAVATVRLAATCATLQPGEALRLSIAGAAFPAYAVNPGTGADPKTATGASALVTTLGVHYGAGQPSRLLLNLV
ncbi:CocE/NonD family hydrolase [Verticiella sediminum]|uniref:CocE/NonD family hydrolase n=1 Tax=Verticiella sediminum TaxID=1247510 RepID=A0A556AGW9_9BURK|nr:CocE/NonD family hydrolase [Verticiella sediminum]TSH92121.1 CocE/NonD family hydrolase [Verticiella sediminum]